MASRSLAGLLLFALGACGLRESLPPSRAHDARFGRLGGSGETPSQRAWCSKWSTIAGWRDENAMAHTSFPETNMQDACFSYVRHVGREARADDPQRGCAYPAADTRAQLTKLADEVERGDPRVKKLLPCNLDAEARAATLKHNAKVLRALAADKRTYAYSALIIPGHGVEAQNQTPLVGVKPGDECRALAEMDFVRLGQMPTRAARAADALRGNVAPVAIVSGGAIHSRVVEAFAFLQLLQCHERVEPERVLVEPCAEHTHTNLRNSSRWINEMHGRSAYLLTDPHLQADYFQDFSGFEFIFGNIDQRSLRDWGYVIGSWREASIGLKGGFWFTPYRFWAEPRDELGSMTCVDIPEFGP